MPELPACEGLALLSKSNGTSLNRQKWGLFLRRRTVPVFMHGPIQ